MRKVIDRLPDIQHTSKPLFPLYINRVGVQNVKVPFKLDAMKGGTYDLIANVVMTTDLAKDIKGISMSMLLRTLLEYLNKPLKHYVIKEILEKFKTAVETDSKHSQIKFEFDLPIIRSAPKSGISFPQFYKCAFEGRLDGKKFRFFQKVKIQYASYCPCSASLCNALENNQIGHPHAQRSYAELVVETSNKKIIWLESLIDLIENAVSNKVYPILRRVDEQEVARIAGSNTQFVEDSIRMICHELNKKQKSGIKDWIIKCEHQESLHMNEAIAMSWKNIPGGFDGTYYL